MASWFEGFSTPMLPPLRSVVTATAFRRRSPLLSPALLLGCGAGSVNRRAHVSNPFVVIRAVFELERHALFPHSLATWSTFRTLE